MIWKFSQWSLDLNAMFNHIMEDFNDLAAKLARVRVERVTSWS